MSFLSLVWSDMRRAYPNRRTLVTFFRSTLNPSIHASILIRACQFSPPGTFWLWRRLLLLFHGIDVGKGIRIGNRLSLPHPTGIVLGGGAVIGDNVSIFQGVTIGSLRGEYPTIQDNVIIYPNSVIVGSVVMKDGERVRALSLVQPNQKNKYDVFTE